MEHPIKSNERFGMSVEVALCELFGCEYSIAESRINREDVDLVKSRVSNYDMPFKIVKYTGKENKKVDFLTENKKTVSVKSNKTGFFMVCPQMIGQKSKKAFCTYFEIQFTDLTDIKKYIFENITKMIKSYFDCLFCCDYLLWFSKDGTIKLFERQEMFHKFEMLDLSKMSWNKTLVEWNESITLSYEGRKVGEMQIHKNIDCIKFRFDIRFFDNKADEKQNRKLKTPSKLIDLDDHLIFEYFAGFVSNPNIHFQNLNRIFLAYS